MIYPMFLRILGTGAETGDAEIPRTVGIPMSAGQTLGVYVGWHNETGLAVENVFVRVTMKYTPSNQVPAAVDVLPLLMDVAMLVGDRNNYDVPPGRLETSHEFELPVGGRLLAVGGHMHDHGVSVRLEDAQTGRVLFELQSTLDSVGHIRKVERRLFGVSGRGLPLRAGRRYRVVGVYDNPTTDTLIHGGMANLVGIFAPEDLSAWPAVDLGDPWTQRDLATLRLPTEFRLP
jgi:hypothetical protein